MSAALSRPSLLSFQKTTQLPPMPYKWNKGTKTINPDMPYKFASIRPQFL